MLHHIIMHLCMLCLCDVAVVELKWCPAQALPPFRCARIEPSPSPFTSLLPSPSPAPITNDEPDVLDAL